MKISYCLAIIIILIIIMSIELCRNSLTAGIDFIGVPNHCQNIDDHRLMCQVKKHTYIINKIDSIVSYPLRCGNYWESWMHNYFKKYSDLNKNCLDIGANIGTHTVICSEYFQHVYSFEPQKDVFNILKQNIDVNHCNNVIPYNMGLSNEKTQFKMKCYDHQKSTNIGALNIVENNEEGCETIQVVPLDLLEINNIALIKIDVEGHEYKALLGGLNTIKLNRPIIIFEEHKSNSPVFKLIKSLHYEIRQISLSNDYIAIPK